MLKLKKSNKIKERHSPKEKDVKRRHGARGFFFSCRRGLPLVISMMKFSHFQRALFRRVERLRGVRTGQGKEGNKTTAEVKSVSLQFFS